MPLAEKFPAERSKIKGTKGVDQLDAEGPRGMKDDAIERPQDCAAEAEVLEGRVNARNGPAQSFHESLGFTRAATYEYTLDLQGQP